MRTIEQKRQEVENYINKTSKHLFTNDAGIMFKIIPFEVQGKKYFAYINYSTLAFKFFIQEMSTDLDYLKHWVLFPTGHKMRSIPNFKTSKVAFGKIREILATYTGDKATEQVMQTRISLILREMQIQTV